MAWGRADGELKDPAEVGLGGEAGSFGDLMKLERLAAKELRGQPDSTAGKLVNR